MHKSNITKYWEHEQYIWTKSKLKEIMTELIHEYWNQKLCPILNMVASMFPVLWPIDGIVKTTRVSHNQGYHLVCTWGQKWSFLHCPKNNCTWKSIDYSVWNPNFAKLSLIFIEIYKFENPSLTRHFRVGGATQCWYDIHFYWVLLMIIFNWTY